ncbi:MAG: hypothetical protein M1819_007325 [Sarea resinae]|nr:MAG: hypothetical protein M1819_007325 [Sarea resinae]
MVDQVSASSTGAQRVDLGPFHAQYANEGSIVRGYWVTDVFRLGGAAIQDLVMGVATLAISQPQGILGLGLDTLSTITMDEDKSSTNILDMLVSQGILNRRAYSLFLDSLGSSSSNLLFGGYDTGKFSGDLVLLPLQIDAGRQQVRSFLIRWTSLYITSSSGSQRVSGAGLGLPYPALLDSGTTFSYIPTPLFDALKPRFNPDSNSHVSCDLRQQDESLDFGFGGCGGPLISVPYSQLIVPSYDSSGNQRVDKRTGEPICLLGVRDGGDRKHSTLGQTFLRSAYVLYDLDGLAAGIAQATNGGSGGNVTEYRGADAPGGNFRIRSLLSGDHSCTNSSSTNSSSTNSSQPATGSGGPISIPNPPWADNVTKPRPGVVVFPPLNPQALNPQPAAGSSVPVSVPSPPGGVSFTSHLPGVVIPPLQPQPLNPQPAASSSSIVSIPNPLRGINVTKSMSIISLSINSSQLAVGSGGPVSIPNPSGGVNVTNPPPSVFHRSHRRQYS